MGMIVRRPDQSRERSTQTAVAAIPSSLPMKPRPSVLVAFTDTDSISVTPGRSARVTIIALRRGAMRTLSATSVTSQPAPYQPAPRAPTDARRTICIESAPVQRGSSEGKCSPMAPSPAAPKTASTTAWATRSPSEVAWTPRVSSTTTPARRSGGVGANRWASYPQPTRTSVPRYTDGGSVPGGLDDRQGWVETLGSLLLVGLEGECQLGYQCHPGLRPHPLEGRANALRLLGVGEVSDDLRRLEDVSGSHLLVENLVPAAPVGAGFLGLLLQGLEDVAGCRLGDDRTDQVLHGVDRHHHRQLFGGDVEHVVVALLAIELLLDLFDDGGSPVLGMDDLVTYGELRFFGCHGELRGLSGLLGVTESNRAVSSIEIRVPGF